MANTWFLVVLPMRVASVLATVLALSVVSNATPGRAADQGITSTQADQILGELRKIPELPVFDVEIREPLAKPTLARVPALFTHSNEVREVRNGVRLPQS